MVKQYRGVDKFYSSGKPIPQKIRRKIFFAIKKVRKNKKNKQVKKK